jgi:hypothetical protein
MPERDPEAHQNGRLLTVLIWAGVGLAPVAALVVLLGGSDNSVRFAVLLIAVSVVLVGAALLIRNDPVLLRMDVEDQVEALREELTANVHATGARVKALQDEMTRMRAAGSPATGLAPAMGLAPAVGASPVMGQPSANGVPLTNGGRAMVGQAGGRGPEAGREAGQVLAGRPAVATASVAPPEGHTSVARIPAVASVSGSASVGSASVGSTSTGFASVGSASVGSASLRSASVGSASVASGSVGSASVGMASVGFASVGSASVPFASGGFGVAGVPAAALPRQRGAAAVAPASGGVYEGEYGIGRAEPAARAVSDYGPGLSGSAWAERSVAVEYGADADGGHVAANGSGYAAAGGGYAAADSGGYAATAGGGYPAADSGGYAAAAGGAFMAADRGGFATEPAGDGFMASDGAGFPAADGGVPAEPRQSRRHAAPDTGTDIARYGLDGSAVRASHDYSAEYGLHGGYDQTGDSSWPGQDGYGDGGEVSGFFAQHETAGTGYPQPIDHGQISARDIGYGQAADHDGHGPGAPAAYGQAADHDRHGHDEPSGHDQPADYDGQGYDGQGYDGQGYDGQGYDGQGYDGQATARRSAMAR